jgi:hypothetical protein
MNQRRLENLPPAEIYQILLDHLRAVSQHFHSPFVCLLQYS